MGLADKVGTGEVVSLDPGTLKPGPSIRQTKLSIDHVNRLRPVLDACPPIVVAHPQMTIVDGHHRVGAASHERVTVRAVLVSLSTDEIFEQAVKANITHGLLLTADERKSNAQKMLKAHPEWSDRRVAEACGLDHKTVAGLRPRSTGDGPQLNRREGADGRSRPADPVAQRKSIDETLDRLPNASARLTATLTGASPATVAKRKKEREGQRHLESVADDPTTVERGQEVRVGDVVTLLPGNWTRTEWAERSDAARDAAQFLNRWVRASSFRKAADKALPALPLEAYPDVLVGIEWMCDALNDFADQLRKGRPSLKEATDG